MKIITVAIPNHHFFQWVNQLEEAGHDVFWFDVTDGGPESSKIHWVTQIKGWKLRWDFPMRSGVKSRLPRMYKWIQGFNENGVESAFAKAYTDIQPDMVHCFEMQLAGLPILSLMQTVEVPLIYSSWGSDLFDFTRLGVTQEQVTSFLKRVDYLITDCKRDHLIAKRNGFKGTFLGVFPGNGGLDLNKNNIKSSEERTLIMIKGYDDGVGKASIVLSALEQIDGDELQDKEIIIYSADRSIEKQVNRSERLSSLPVTVYPRHSFIQNTDLIALMGRSCIHIASSISDGMPNALLEAMGMGAFPIQSNPGGATEEVINDGENGLLIQDPNNPLEIASLIKKALTNDALRTRAQEINMRFIFENYSRSILRSQIVSLYQKMYNQHFS